MSHVVTLPYDPVWKPLEWAKQHCSSYITNDVHIDQLNTYDQQYIDYFFGDAKDAMWFTLKWHNETL